MFELRGLGTVGLHDERGELLAVSPKPLALLVYLAVARPRGPQQRDILLALFHPELDHRHARTALRQLLHVLRTVVGDDVVRSNRQTVALEPGWLTCDVHSFEAALAAAHHEKAVEIYRGPFLPGFFLNGCLEFERWVEAERSRLQRAYAGALERLALEADAAGDAARAVALWRQLAEVDPYATRVTVRLIAALEVAGDRAGALKVAESHARRLKQELDAEPSPDVEALARRLRVQPVPSTPVPGGSTRERLARAVAGRYRVDRVAGAGGMALVYLAEDMKLGRRVALKVLRPELAAAIGHERFLNEIDIAASLAHPNILPLHDAGEADGLVYYVMPYVEGESLRARLAREGPLQLSEAVRITREVADALGHAHEQGIVHRDIKPANILLLADHAVVSDFGVARALGNAVEDRALVATTGTPAYMSPEQAAGSPDVNARSDLYSLGCVLHEMLTGAPPQREYETQAVLAATSPVGETMPATIEAALAKSLAPVPAERFASAAEFAEALHAEPADESGSVKRRRGARRVGALVAGAVSIAVAATAVWRVWLGPEPHFTVSNNRHVTRAPEVEIQPAISPDGREVVYSAAVGHDWHLFVRDLGGGRAYPLTADWPVFQEAPRWTADGRGILFQQPSDRPGASATSHLIPRFGGPARMIVDARAWDIRNGRVVYSRDEGLFVRGVEGGEETLVARQLPQVHSATWSLDGSKLAYVQGNDDWVHVASLGNVSSSSIWVVGAHGGRPVQVTDDTNLNLSPAWMPDGGHLLFISNRDGTRDIYAVRVDASGRSRNRPVRVTSGLSANSISVSADGSTVAYSQFAFRQNIWEIALPETGTVSISEARPVTTGNQIIENHGISRDGRWLTFDSNLEGNQDIYVMPLDGGEPRRVTSDPAADYHPDFSPDGTEIVFYSVRHGNRDVFLISVDGSHEVQLTDSPAEDMRPSFSPDGLHIVFIRRDSVNQGGEYMMSRDSIGGEWSAPQALDSNARGRCVYLRWSPDGSQLSCWGIGAKLWLISPQGDERLLVDAAAMGLLGTTWPDWSPDGRTVYFQSMDSAYVGGLYAISPEGDGLREIVRFDDPTKQVNFAPTLADGKAYFSLKEIESDIWVLDLEW